MGRHTVHEPRRETNKVACLCKEVVVMVERSPGLKIPLAEVLLVVMCWRRTSRIHKHDGRLPWRRLCIKDATRKGSLVNVVTMAATIFQIDCSPHVNVGILAIVFAQWIASLSRVLDEGFLHERFELLVLLRIVQFWPVPHLRMKEGIIDVIRIRLASSLPTRRKCTVLGDGDCGQLLGETFAEIPDNIHRGDQGGEEGPYCHRCECNFNLLPRASVSNPIRIHRRHGRPLMAHL
mmetsp:Transcript_49899/g.139674  ORF Transcript_49899/g.139674 Transcript_49899/m.139674 type:complete len:235 (+) Transcript_49899:289-993(+)